jgi:hypothetical protein
MKSRFVILISLLLASAHAHAINKCMAPDGKVSYQDAPCDASSTPSKIKANSASDPGEAQRTRLRAQGEAARVKAIEVQREIEFQQRRAQEIRDNAATDKRNRLAKAAWEHRVAIGHSAAQVREAWGEPTRINRSIHTGRTYEQWVYRGADAHSTQYVYLENGVVTSMQE